MPQPPYSPEGGAEQDYKKLLFKCTEDWKNAGIRALYQRGDYFEWYQIDIHE